mgnify:CR=1 FL=1|tara:strand:- start:559 stop:1077 length:519 start_codon:yes stop_codon:yes gene_type:complete
MTEKLHIKILENEIVKLRQTKKDDFDKLFKLGGKKEIWEQHSDKDRYKKSIFLKYFNQGLKNEFGSLTIISKNDGKIAGWTRLYDFDEKKPTVKIGFTFLGKCYWGSNINYNSKKLILNHLFSFLDLVCFDIFEENIRSQKAVKKLGGLYNEKRENKHHYILDKKSWINHKD